MKKRLQKLERIRTVRARMHELEEWKMAALNREKAALEEDQRTLIAALNDDDALQGLFIDATARRLNVLARKTERVNRERERQNRRLVDAGLDLKRTERMSERARREHGETLRRKGFQTILDIVAGKDDASSP